MARTKNDNPLASTLRVGWSAIAFAGVFSFVTNVLFLAFPLYMNQVYSRVITSHSVPTLMVLTGGILAIFVFSSLLDDLRSRIMINFSVLIDRLVSGRVLGALFEGAVRFDPNARSQALRDLDNFRQAVTGAGVGVLFDVPWIPVFLAILFYIDPYIGAVTSLGGVVLLILAFAQHRASARSLQAANEAAIRSYSFVEAGLRNGEVVRALGMFRTVGARWAEQRQSVIELQTLASRRASSYSSAIKTFRLMLQIIVVALGAYLVITDVISPALLFANMILSARALAPIERVVASWSSLVSGMQSYERVGALLAKYPAPATATALPAPLGRVAADKMSFGLPGTARLLVQSISFELQPGETLGILGDSGAGKSTLTRLLVGVWKPFSGTIRLDGADVFTWDRADFGKHVGYLPQDTELFAGTVRDNIARFRDDVDDAVVIEAARAAGAHDLILQLANGYDTELGEGGSVLSPGQRQRVGLARALLGNPTFVVLDEPNSNLDAAGESALVAALEGLKARGATVVIVSHKPSLFRYADKLLVLKDGKVDMFGPRDKVLDKVMQRAGTVRRPRGPGKPEPSQPGSAPTEATS